MYLMHIFLSIFCFKGLKYLPVMSFYAVSTVNNALKALEIWGLSKNCSNSIKVYILSQLKDIISSNLIWWYIVLWYMISKQAILLCD